MKWFFILQIILASGDLGFVLSGPTIYATEEECLESAVELAWSRRMVNPEWTIEVECFTEQSNPVVP